MVSNICFKNGSCVKALKRRNLALLLGKTIKSWKPETKPSKSIPGVRKCEKAEENISLLRRKKLDYFIYTGIVFSSHAFVFCQNPKLY